MLGKSHQNKSNKKSTLNFVDISEKSMEIIKTNKNRFLAHFLLEKFREVCGFDLDTSALVIYSSGMTKSFHEKFNRKITNSNTRGEISRMGKCNSYLHRVFPDSNGSGTCVNTTLLTAFVPFWIYANAEPWKQTPRKCTGQHLQSFHFQFTNRCIFTNAQCLKIIQKVSFFNTYNFLITVL